MKAPDKIYVKEFDEGISQMWSSIRATESTANVQHEYIRKDALLKWISGARAIPREYAQIRDLAFQEMVNYLNTM